jgi:hypothetical protein
MVIDEKRFARVFVLVLIRSAGVCGVLDGCVQVWYLLYE